MKALSVRQPWAWAIVAGHKRIENRSWPTHHRGPLAIHASKTLGEYVPHWRLPNGAAIPPGDELALGAILGTVEVADCVPADADEVAGDPFGGGPWCWILANPKALPVPVAWKGACSLWHVPDEVFRQLREARSA